ncbi:MAG: hypothetical protein RR101_05150 [Burkholderiaceae bacterium]
MNKSIRWLGLIWVATLIAGCASLGPPALRVSASDIEARFAGLDRVVNQFEGLQLSGPKVGFLLASDRIELAWTAKLPDGVVALPIAVRATLTGKPVLNDAGDGIDLDEVRFEGLSVRSLPFLPALRETRGSTLAGRLPLLNFDPDELRRGDVLYRATGLSLGANGMTVDLAPR